MTCAALPFKCPAAAAEATSEWASIACKAFDAAAICAALLGMWANDEALLQTAEISCGLIMCALLARLAKASALLPIDEKTFGSFDSAAIALVSWASFWKAAALLAM